MNAGIQRRTVTASMTEGLGLPQPARISIHGAMFTLIDRAGNEQMCNLVDPQVGRYLDVIIVGANQNKSKIYYEGDWSPQSSDPPVCWSDNGVAPSAQSITPQSPTCGQCEWNKIGSDQSKLSGKPIKACQDRKKLACFVVGDPSKELYQFQVTPAALKGLAAYGKWVAQHPSSTGQGAADVSEVITRLYFQPGQQGVVGFAAVAGIDPADNARIDAVYAQGLVAEVTGANDVPISNQLTGPAPQQQWAPPPVQQIAPPPAQQFTAAQPVNHAPQVGPPGHEWSVAAQRWIPVDAQGAAINQHGIHPAPAAPPPPPQPMWNGSAWVLPAAPGPDPTLAPPAPGSDPYAVPGFLQRPTALQGGNPVSPGAAVQQGPATAVSPSEPQAAFSAPPPKGKGTRGGARTGAGRKPADVGAGSLPAQPAGVFPAQQQAQPAHKPATAPFMPAGAPANAPPPPQAQQQFGMAPAGPPPIDMAAALDRAFSTPLPPR